MNVLVLHGVNLDMFGKRDPSIYGTVTLPEIDAALKSLGAELGADVDCFQSNVEGVLCERIHRAHGAVDIVSLPQLPQPLNSMLLRLSRVDRAVLTRRDLPVGSSVFVAATRSDCAAGSAVERPARHHPGPHVGGGARQARRQRSGRERVDLGPHPRLEPQVEHLPATGAADRDRAQRAVEHPPGLPHEVADRDGPPRREHLGDRKSVV